MDQELKTLKEKFDSITVVDKENKIEFWYARDLMGELGYISWEKFQSVIKKAMKSCETAGYDNLNHFHGAVKMVSIGSKAKREIQDYMLTRYACYLIAQNGDPRKKEIAFAQSYFAIQTRKLELIEERMRLNARFEARERLRKSEKELSKNIYERGVDDSGFARIRSKGDAALFGGKTTSDMKAHYGVNKKRALADFLPGVTIAAKNLATELTNYNVKDQNMFGEKKITGEHVQNNTSIRKTLEERGIKPEELPPEEDIKKMERRVKSREKKLIQSSGKLLEKEQKADRKQNDFENVSNQLEKILKLVDIPKEEIDTKGINKLSEIKQQNIISILDYMRERKDVGIEEVATAIKKSTTTARTYLNLMAKLGLLKVQK